MTVNPALDLTYILSGAPDPGAEVHRASQVMLEASGKGVNVSRALHGAGVSTQAVLALGGPTGRHLEDLLDRDGVPTRVVRQEGSTRVNTTVLQPGGQALKVNGPGPVLDAATQNALVDVVSATLGETATGTDGEAWLVVCGRMPAHAGADLVRRFVHAAADAGARCAVDTSGAALLAAMDAGADLVAPNRSELAEVDALVADAGDEIGALARVVTDVAWHRGCALLVSLGAMGALWTDGRTTLQAGGPALEPVNTAGAGDALLAGWLAAPGDPADRLRRAVRWGRSACMVPTTVDPTPGSDPAQPSVHELAITTR